VCVCCVGDRGVDDDLRKRLFSSARVLCELWGDTVGHHEWGQQVRVMGISG
jgi:hypothetical protein